MALFVSLLLNHSCRFPKLWPVRSLSRTDAVCVAIGDAWSLALEYLDVSSLRMAQIVVLESMEHASVAARRPMPESLAWKLMAALNQVSNPWVL